jgi:hypothetical protein
MTGHHSTGMGWQFKLQLAAETSSPKLRQVIYYILAMRIQPELHANRNTIMLRASSKSGHTKVLPHFLQWATRYSV